MYYIIYIIYLTRKDECAAIILFTSKTKCVNYCFGYFFFFFTDNDIVIYYTKRKKKKSKIKDVNQNSKFKPLMLRLVLTTHHN